jgi:hypothetical protein
MKIFIVGARKQMLVARRHKERGKLAVRSAQTRLNQDNEELSRRIQNYAALYFLISKNV